MRLKVETVEQYHILKWLDENLYIQALKVELLDKDKIRIVDCNGDSAIVECINKNNIVLKEEKAEGYVLNMHVGASEILKGVLKCVRIEEVKEEKPCHR